MPRLFPGLVAMLLAAPAFAAALRAYWKVTGDGDQATAQALLAWIGGQPSVSAAARRAAGVKGDLDHFAALGFLQGLLTILRDSGHPGLLLVLDEIETLQRVRSDVRDKALNALRQLVDDVDSGRFPWLYLLITGAGALVLDPVLKSLVGRLRPVVAHPIAHGNGNSFPSGHTMNAVIFYGGVALLLWSIYGRRVGVVAVVVATIIAIGVGISRIYLGYHYLPDVVEVRPV